MLANSFSSAQEATFFDITIIRINTCLREDNSWNITYCLCNTVYKLVCL